MDSKSVGTKRGRQEHSPEMDCDSEGEPRRLVLANRSPQKQVLFGVKKHAKSLWRDNTL